MYYSNEKLSIDKKTDELIYAGVRLGITIEYLGEWRIITGIDPVTLLMGRYSERLAERRSERIDEIL